MPRITGGKRRPSRCGYPGDLHVADLDSMPDLALPRSEHRGDFRGATIERQHPATEHVVDGAKERAIETVAPSAGGEQCEPKSDFEHCHRRGPDRLRRLC